MTVHKLFEAKNRERVRRSLRLRRRRVARAGESAEAMVDKHFFGRIGKAANVRRFLASWVGLIVLLIAAVIGQSMSLGRYYLLAKPSDGGTYREGLVGAFTNANPIYATSSADRTVSALVFSSLLTFNSENQLAPDLAKDWSVDASGKIYVVNLRNDVRWHDGMPFKAEDVVYTFQTIQNADARSPLQRNWQGVTVTAEGDYKVIFTLSSALAGFEYSLITGIVPKHILSSVAPSQLRSNNFNTIKLIGTGPFKLKSVEVSGDTADDRLEQISLSANTEYYRGNPALENFVVRVYRNQLALRDAFNHHEINAAVGMSPNDIDQKDETITTISVPETSATMVFLNNSSPILSELAVRQALLKATNTKEIRNRIGYPLIEVNEPFLRGQVGYDPAYVQDGYDKAAAEALLDGAGWVKNSEGIREKSGQRLKLRLFSQSLAEYALVTQQLQGQWKQVGVETDVILQPEDELQTGAIARHDYDALLYGISIGPDSDIYAYWHSSQADPRSQSRLNLSEYKSVTADKALESGRTRNDPTLRALRYKVFLDAWKKDAPAIGLYQPRFFYVVRGVLTGFESTRVNTNSDRFVNVNNWKIRQERTAE